MCRKKFINNNTMGRPKKKKQDKDLLETLAVETPTVEEPTVEEPTVEEPTVEAPKMKTKRSTSDIHSALLLNYSKITLKRRGLM
jgi:hypothetical protein